MLEYPSSKREGILCILLVSNRVCIWRPKAKICRVITERLELETHWPCMNPIDIDSILGLKKWSK
jgi:hypothetical protein